MSGGYSHTTWVNGSSPAISAANLQKIEDALQHGLGFDDAAALRAYGTPTSIQTAWTRGALACGDGGHGIWRWDATATASDNVGTVLLPTSHAGAGRWVRLEDGAINCGWFGLDPDDDTFDAQSAIQAAIDLGSARAVARGFAGWPREDIEYAPEKVYLPPGFHYVLSTVIVKKGIDFEMQGTLVADTGFSGTEVLQIYGVDDETDRPFETIIAPCRIDGNNLDVKGVAGVNGRRVKIRDAVIYHTGDHGIDTGGLAGVMIDKAYISGCDYAVFQYPLISATQVAGLFIDEADAVCTDIVVQNYPIGIWIDSQSCKLTHANCGSREFDAFGAVEQNGMRIGILCDRIKNILTNCTVGRVYPESDASAPSLTNGGYQIAVDNARNQIVNAYCQASGDYSKTSGAVMPFFVGGIKNTFINPLVVDDSTDTILDTEHWDFESQTIERATTIIGGNFEESDAAGDRNEQFAQDDVFSQQITFKVGGSDTGVTYDTGRRFLLYHKIGGVVHFMTNIRISSIGALTGDVTIEDFPLAPKDMSIGTAAGPFFAIGGNDASAKPVLFGRLEQATTVLKVYNSDGTRTDDTDLSLPQDFYVTGTYIFDQP